ncbi:MAG: caspase family protein, partial [Bacteroidota bacterium]
MKTITFFIFSLALFLSFSLPAQKAQKPVNRGMTPKEVKVDTVGLAHIYSQRYALLIGNSHYKNGWDSLKGVITDIEYVKKTLEGLGFNVIVKMDQNATEMPEAYKSFIADYGSDGQSCLLFYYAGHGCTIKIRGKDMGYILPVDCPKVPKDEKNMKDFLTHAMSMDDFEQYAKLIWSNHALFLFDACFAGSIFENMRGSAAEEAIQRKAAQPVRQFITSGSADESVPDNSYFRELLVEALNGSADANNDHYVTGRE